MHLGREFEQVLAEALAQLPADLRAAVVLRDLEGLSTEEAASAIGVVRRLSRAACIVGGCSCARCSNRICGSSRRTPTDHLAAGISIVTPHASPERS